MPEYKVYYFDFRGKGELIRLMLELAGAKYENIRIPGAEWEDRKKELNLPYGQLPLLSIDGKMYSQTLSIARHLAEEFGLAGKSPLNKLRADMIAHCLDDFAWRPIYIFREKDEKVKAEQTAKYRKEELPMHCGNLEKILKENNGGDGFFVGDSLTWADVTFYTYISMTRLISIEVASYIGDFPKLKALFQRIEKIPAVASWIVRRPDDPF